MMNDNRDVDDGDDLSDVDRGECDDLALVLLPLLCLVVLEEPERPGVLQLAAYQQGQDQANYL